VSNDLFDLPDTTTADGIKRDRWGRYILPVPNGSGGELVYRRVTTFVKAASDTYLLSKWAQRMTLVGVTMREDLYALAAAASDRQTLDRITEDCQIAAGTKHRAQLGTALHGFAEAADKGTVRTVPVRWQPEIQTYLATMKHYGIVFNDKYIERVVVNDAYNVAGTFDRIGTLTAPLTFDVDGQAVRLEAGERVILDLKTGRTLDFGWGEIAAQLECYATADRMWVQGTTAYEPMPKVNARWGLVVHLPVRETDQDEVFCKVLAVDLVAGHVGNVICQKVWEWRGLKNLSHNVSLGDGQSIEVRPDDDQQATPAPSLDGMRCIQCKAQYAGETVKHLPTCPDYPRNSQPVTDVRAALDGIQRCAECGRTAPDDGRITHARSCKSKPPKRTAAYLAREAAKQGVVGDQQDTPADDGSGLSPTVPTLAIGTDDGRMVSIPTPARICKHCATTGVCGCAGIVADIASATTRDQLRTIWRAAMAASRWNDSLRDVMASRDAEITATVVAAPDEVMTCPHCGGTECVCESTILRLRASTTKAQLVAIHHEVKGEGGWNDALKRVATEMLASVQ
jgi:hypothetical protein